MGDANGDDADGGDHEHTLDIPQNANHVSGNDK